MKSGARAIAVVGLALMKVACSEPSLEVPRPAQVDVSLKLQPAGDAERAPRLFRAEVGGVSSLAEPWLFRGGLSSYHEGAVRRGELPSTLRERALPLRFWREAEKLWLQPLALLDAREGYTLALTGYGTLQAFETVDAAPVAQRLFPPPGTPSARVTVLCDAPNAEAVTQLLLEPGHVPVAVSQGVLGVERSGCLTLEVTSPLELDAVLPPELGGALSSPELFRAEASAEAEPATACAGGIAVGSGCVEALDDRLLVTSRADSLWVLTEPEARSVVVEAEARAELLRGLAPDSRVQLAGQALDRFGELSPFRLELQTGPPRRHLVLNEVMANPRGAEPASEWIELVNDSDRATTLAGLWLEDGAGSVALPAVAVGPGESVLLVAEAQPGSGLDVPLPSGAHVVELGSLGARGLSNGGEALLLVGQEGVVSRFPQVAASEAGRSVARRWLGSADDLASQFALHGEPGASPGAPNSFDD